MAFGPLRNNQYKGVGANVKSFVLGGRGVMHLLDSVFWTCLLIHTSLIQVGECRDMIKQPLHHLVWANTSEGLLGNDSLQAVK